MNRVGLAALALLLALPLAMPSAQASPAPVEWWGPKAIEEGFHMRVPVEVTNPHAYPMTNAPVAVELDLGAKLLAAGWTSAAGGDRDVLTGFRLDAASIRVVSMTNLLPADNVNGRLKVADPTFPAGDDRRFEVPSTHVLGSLSSGSPFDAAVNPVITVLWRAAGTLQPGESRAFVVYFDSERTSTPKSPRDDGLTLADGDLRSLFGPGPSLTAFGYVAPEAGTAGRIHVTALHAATRIAVFTSTIGGVGTAPGPLQPLSGQHQFTLAQAHETLQVTVTTAGPVAVKVVADKPVLVQGSSAGFVPALDGGATGRDFLFYTTDAGTGQDSLYVTAHDPRAAAGAKEPTRVEVTALATGRVLAYETGSDLNPFHYTVGPRAAMEATGTTCRDDGASPFLAPGSNVQDPPPALYRARVVSGERVSLQLLTLTGVAQVPSGIGAPAGTTFWTALPYSEDNPGRFGPCASVSTQAGVWTATSLAAPTSANVTSPELSYQVSPPGTPSPPGPPAGRYPAPQAVPQAPAFSSPAAVAMRPAADRPLLLATGAEAMAFSGVNPRGVGTPPIHGPYVGDDAGRTFAGLGRALVFAPYSGTVAGVQATYAQGASSLALPIATGGIAVVDDASTQNPLRGFRLQANKPVMATPASASTSFFPGVPAMLAASSGPAAYRGYLVDLSSPEGLDPVTGSTPPGDAIEYSVRLSNRARALDGSPLPDLVKVTAAVPEGWTATLDGLALSGTQGPSLSLGGGETRSLRLLVSPPLGLGSGASGTVALRAVSQNNELVEDTLDVVTYVKTLFETGIWFDAVGGPKEQTNSSMSAGGLFNFTLVVQNLGSKAEHLHLATQFRGGEASWAASLGSLDGGDQLDIELDARETAALALVMRAPPGLVDGEATVVVTAEVVGIASSRDVVQATGLRRAPADLSLTTDGLTRVASPGQNATFNLTIQNRGAGAANLQLAVRSGPGSAWGPARILQAGVPLTGSDLGVDAGGVQKVQVVVPAKASALAGQSVTLRFTARQDAGATGSLEAVLTGVVRAVHRLQAATPPLPLALLPGTNATFELRLTNSGNVDEMLLVRTAGAPAGWLLDAPRETLVPRGKTVPVKLTVEVPGGSPPARGNLTLEFVSRDGNITRLAMPAEIGLGAAFATASGASRAVQPGRVAGIEVPAANEGNTPLVVRVRPAPGEPWDLEPTPALRLQPGERVALPVAWRIPADAADGATVHRAVLALEPEGLEPSTRPIEATFDVGRADLEVADISSADGPAGRLVHATVRNTGVRPAQDFTVALRVAGTVVDALVVGELRPGEDVGLTLLQSQAGAAWVTLDANGTVLESDEKDNEAAVSEAGARQASLGGMGLLAAFLALGLARRRRA